jgi:hypothetical protein
MRQLELIPSAVLKFSNSQVQGQYHRELHSHIQKDTLNATIVLSHAKLYRRSSDVK